VSQDGDGADSKSKSKAAADADAAKQVEAAKQAEAAADKADAEAEEKADKAEEKAEAAADKAEEKADKAELEAEQAEADAKVKAEKAVVKAAEDKAEQVAEDKAEQAEVAAILADKPSGKSEPKKPEPTQPEPEKSDGVVSKRAKIPPTRKLETQPQEPPERPSQSQDLHAPLIYPDGRFSSAIRSLDTLVGRIEQIALVSLLVIIVGVAAGHAILDRIAHIRLEFKDDVVKGGTFAIAMIGAAFATQQGRNLAMDLVSRRMSPRARLFLKAFLGLFTIFIVSLLVRASFGTIAIQKPSESLISPRHIAWMIPLGGGLIMLHALLHFAIDVDYIRRRQVPPERMRSGH
jgi:TRAP-type C4-dicarboxylate transport system permease small subunit